MAAVNLKYGGKTLKLEKSPTVVGVRPRTGREGALELSATRMGARTLHESLGGFEMVDVESAEQPMESTLDALRGSPEVGVGTHVYYTSDDEVPFVPTGQLYIEFSESADQDKCDAILGELALEIIESRGPHELIARVTSSSPNPVKAAAILQDSGLVDVAEPELATPGKLASVVVPNDPHLVQQWHLLNTGAINGSTYRLKAGADARVVAAWQRSGTLGSPDVIVAVIDDGFDLRHPDLSGPGKVVAPWDFSRSSAHPRPGHLDWHGTACAGVAIGSANAYGIVGAAPGCRFMPIRWGKYIEDSQIERWFGYVQQHGAWIVSCSWGVDAAVFHLSTRMNKALHRCATQGRNGLGCVIVFAAGNEDSDVNDPEERSVSGFAIHPDVIAVAACTSMDERSDYSNFGKEISVSAPSSGAGGRGIFTADVMGARGYSDGDFTRSFGGTSSACPLVAGICGLILSINPSLSAAQVKDLIQKTARKIGKKSQYNAKGHSREFGYGCVDADSVVKALLATNGRAAPKSRRTRRPRTAVAR